MPRNPAARRIVGGYMWRDSIERCIRLEQEQIASLRQLMARTDNPDRLRQYGEMLAAKVEIVTILHELLLYNQKAE